MTFSIMTLGILTLSIKTHRKTSRSLTVIKCDTEHNDTEHNDIQFVCRVSFMVSVTIKSIMLGYAECRYADCCGSAE